MQGFSRNVATLGVGLVEHTSSIVPKVNDEKLQQERLAT